MKLRVAPSLVFHAFVPCAPSSPFTSPSGLRKFESISFSLVLSDPFVSKSLLKSQIVSKLSRTRSFRTSCSSNLDGVEDSSFHLEGAKGVDGGIYSKKRRGGLNKKVHYAISRKTFAGKDEIDHELFLHPRFDLLEPMMFGIRPDFPDWPDQETAVWATIEQKAKNFDIPLSLRMIKKKLQCEEGSTDFKESSHCAVKAAFASMVFIIGELQSYALHMREALCDEDLETVSFKVQKEMHSSFVWLFQQVFSRTPSLMLDVMILLADFSVYSASNNIGPISSTSHVLSTKGNEIQNYLQINSSLASEAGIDEQKIESVPQSSSYSSVYQGEQLQSVEEMNLWNSMLDYTTNMRGVEDDAVNHNTVKHFVAPVSVKLEPDKYEEYLRTDLLYQMSLSREPNNPLLLCNYARYLHLVAHDYDRAEECFKRAVQVLPPEAESLYQYANFLWTGRRDFLGAEERFLQALSTEPENSYYASAYANFLWKTGAEETCFPLNSFHNPNL